MAVEEVTIGLTVLRRAIGDAVVIPMPKVDSGCTDTSAVVPVPTEIVRVGSTITTEPRASGTFSVFSSSSKVHNILTGSILGNASKNRRAAPRRHTSFICAFESGAGITSGSPLTMLLMYFDKISLSCRGGDFSGVSGRRSCPDFDVENVLERTQDAFDRVSDIVVITIVPLVGGHGISIEDVGEDVGFCSAVRFIREEVAVLAVDCGVVPEVGSGWLSTPLVFFGWFLSGVQIDGLIRRVRRNSSANEIDVEVVFFVTARIGKGS